MVGEQFPSTADVDVLRRANPNLHISIVDEVDIDDRGDEGEPAEMLLDLAPRVPVRPGHRQPLRPTSTRVAADQAPSWWVNRSRAELSAEAEARVPSMRVTREASRVLGITVDR